MRDKQVNSILYLVFLFFVFKVICISAVDEFPDPLTSANFEDEIKTGYHIIEFYSPYCSHCKSLAPIWKETWEKFQKESASSKLKFSQVNCVESGDLCSQEKVRAYPKVSLYQNGSFIKDYPDGNKRTVEQFIKFANEVIQENTENETDSTIDAISNLSKETIPLDKEAIINLLAGGAKFPYFISFWPSDLNYQDDSFTFTNCKDCETFKEKWKSISEHLSDSGIQGAHFDCKKYPEVCKQLNFQELTIKDKEKSPILLLLVPMRKTNNIFEFKDSLDSPESMILDFATRTSFNAQLKHITKGEINEIINRKVDYNNSRSANKLFLVFQYNETQVFQEDFVVLEYLIEILNNYENIYLYQCKDDLRTLILNSYDRFVDLINYNATESKKRRNDEYINMYSITQKPTFFIFREGDLLSSAFNSYSTAEFRSPGYIVSWLDQVNLTKLTEVTEDNFSMLLQYANDIYQIITIQLIDTSSEDMINQSNQYLDNYLLALDDYEHTRMGYLVKLINKKRTDKSNKLDKMKNNKVDDKTIVRTKLQQLEYDFNKKILIAYIDISENLDLLNSYGIKPKDREFEVGDIIIINKQTLKVYYSDISGKDLRASSPFELRESLTSVSIPEISNFKMKGKVLSKIHKSPSKSLHFNISHHLSPQNAIICIVVVILIIFRKFIRHRVAKLLRKSENNDAASNNEFTLTKSKFND
ncbi:hypothetical protein TPHA_0L00710 [Tetrapisispora phaffii CBS 4417]|uniref:Thioredoxin domain-containing protein n=1 Tax=Tetrapisispora phaffii (strain ATCC 24235 / CBS 4417 / NBRC 1672 / NRRL Y-8282 / UCD 70-5) TaxID=1071381 RepID=G8BZU9_TETPH|nr:hypothetical protein TPHA_0L00710 [Tetrapisispora phaffii CBS 4417]CCE65427.1 hypothetical protein TPHA_0L00710 [Tetrapisispora phaffii CBS 4417]